MKIGLREIGPHQPPYIIAEIGVNHDGSVDRAIELVESAKGAGADAIKLQLFETDRLLSKAAKLAAYQQHSGATDPFAMLRRLELTIEQMRPIVSHAHAFGIHAIVTVFSVELVAKAQRLKWDAYKTASPDLINRPLLGALAATGKPLIVSTGAATLDEVECAIAWLSAAHERLAILQCVSSYPTPHERASIAGMRAIKNIWHGPCGYSDHTNGTESIGWIAVAAGANILEKHITWNRRAEGPDHAASAEPDQFAEYVRRARWAVTREFDRFKRNDGWILENDATFGKVEKAVLDIERDVRMTSRQSLTTTRDLPAGHILAPIDLTIKRPGTGIPPWRLNALVGRKLRRNVEADWPIADEDLG